jgi:hypothetical protein
MSGAAGGDVGDRKKILIGILGRGIQQDANGKWVLTPDLEVYDRDHRGWTSHKPVQVASDDSSPDCMIGGSTLNLAAGIALFNKHKRLGYEVLVTAAYGDRSKYLKEVDGPTESRIMMNAFLTLATPTDKEWTFWPEERVVAGNSNTLKEIENLFELAVELGIPEVTLNSVTIHMVRVVMMAEAHLRQPQFKYLKVRYCPSELVLTESDPGNALRALDIYGSAAMARNAVEERIGAEKMIKNPASYDKTFVAASPAAAVNG